MSDCQGCGAALPEPASVGRPRRFCSDGCRFTARRQRDRTRRQDAADTSRRCAATFAGYACDRAAEVTITVDGRTTSVCGRCRDLSLLFLIDHDVPATAVETVPVAVAPPALTTQVRARILLVEDDYAVSDGVTVFLRHRGHAVDVVRDGPTALRTAYASRPDVVLLDLGLPGMDGIEVLRRLRGVSDVPVIVVSARGAINDRMLGLTTGADDYLVKPFDLGELVARIDRILRGRAQERWSAEVYDDGLLRIDSLGREVVVAGEPVALSPTEFLLLETLVRNPGTVQPMDKLLARAWPGTTGRADGRVKFAVSRLRRKLEATPLGSAPIVSARGVGYLYRPPSTPTTPEHRDDIARNLHDLVIQRLFAVGMRLERLKRAVDPAAEAELASSIDSLDEAVREIRNSISSLAVEPGADIQRQAYGCIQDAAAALGFTPSLTVTGELDAVPADVGQDLVATLREALSNVARHADARRVAVEILLIDGALQLSVIDNGVGPPAADSAGSGLANMAKRAERWGGALSLLGASGLGTTLRWKVPLAM